MQKHCFKCNHFKPAVGGGLVLTSNNRKRFVCGSCLPHVSNPLVLRYVAKPREVSETVSEAARTVA